MKKTAVALLIIAALIFGCGKSPTTPVIKQRVSMAIYYDAPGNTYTAAAMGGYNTYIYDASGRMVTNTAYDNLTVLLSSIGYAYNGSGQLSKSSFYDAAAVLQGYAVYDYDGNSRLASMTFYDALNNTQNSLTHTYDGSGKLTTQTFYNASAVEQNHLTYEYNVNGRLVKISNISGTLAGYDSFAYDGNGWLESDTGYNPSDVIQYRIVYSYDGSGKQTKLSFYDLSLTLTGYTALGYETGDGNFKFGDPLNIFNFGAAD